MKRKIVFVIESLHLGGAEKSLVTLLQNLDAAVYDVELLTIVEGGFFKDKVPAWVRWEVIQSTPITVYQRITYFLQKKFSRNKHHTQLLWPIIAKNYTRRTQKYDIAIAYAGPHQFISTYIAKNTQTTKKIQWIHFDVEKVITNFNFGKKVYPYFNNIFCVSRSSKDIFLKHFSELKNKTEVFHNIVSKSELMKQAVFGESFDDNFDGFRILTVGRFTKEKGQHLVPVAVKKLKEDRVKFRWYLVGNGNEKETVEKMAIDLGIASELIFLGEKENPYGYMQNCDIYVQPSLHEGYGITVAEAQVFNKPIVVTNFASAKDLIQYNDTGLITEISSEGLYSAVKSLLMNPGLQKKFTKKSASTATTIENDLKKLMI